MEFERQGGVEEMILLLLLVFALTCTTVVIHALGTLAAIGHLARIWQERKQYRRQGSQSQEILRMIAYSKMGA